MSEDTINYLCARLCHVLEVAITLWKLAIGSEYRRIGHLFGVSLTTVCACVQEFCAAIQTVLVPELIEIPSAERFEEMAAYFENRWGPPQCVGAIDGSHIPIIAPTTYHSDFFNRKGWHSLILQGVVDGRGLFWNIYCHHSGNWPHKKIFFHYILKKSEQSKLDIMSLEAQHILYRTEQQKFNSKLSRARVGVEHAFGRLKGRWRCLLQKNECDMELAKVIVTTCCALHTICENHGEIYDNTWDVSAAEYNPAEAVPRCSDGRTSVRDALVQLLQDNELVF
uniref:DDE Tnp4 domain-containing protein n=1 Tax=Poecilia reticulata TaxID=8081 RepID=A0A3P9P187_POERE